MQGRKRWFKAKSYGWGWTPATWQGWAIVAGYAAVVALCAVIMTMRPLFDLMYGAAMLLAVLATIGIALVAYETGDPPGWHWGDKD